MNESSPVFNRVLIANRGAIAVRIIRTLKKMGITSVVIYHSADENSLHVQHAEIAIPLGEGSVSDTYLNISKVIGIAKCYQVDAIHPGYGFLSENTEFVERCEAEGILFIGPTSDQIQAFGLKHEARALAEENHIPMIPGSPLLKDLQDAITWANNIGYPVMLKSTAGGGGIGMQACHDEPSLISNWETVKRLGANYFSNDGVFLEKYISNARHIEVQIFGDGQGEVIHLGERDCSAQRRNQKVLEETPAPNLDNQIREDIWSTAVRLTSAVNYRNAGTVEFIYDTDQDKFYFLEVNTRLQVEHGVTEEVWGVDLVEMMLLQGGGALGSLTAIAENLAPSGHAIQARIYAENTLNDFLPSAGLLSKVNFPDAAHTRVDSWVESGLEVPALFDPMIAKVICFGKNRANAISSLLGALSKTTLYGVETNLDYVKSIARSTICQQGKLLTCTIKDLLFTSPSISVLNGGTQTTIQDYPARTGYWHVGIPPSGPMDSLSFQQANLLLGNTEDTAGLEITLNGPTLEFHDSTTIALTGADILATLNDKNIKPYQALAINKGDILKIGTIVDSGARAYLAIHGGFNCPEYLGSRSTFTLGQFGGHNGRSLLTGDTLHFNSSAGVTESAPVSIEPACISDEITLRVIYGPHGAPDFFTDEDIQTFFESSWEVHYNSSRTGVRLIGPKPQWARETGGEAGLHPSNIHDNAYAIGAVDFTGDMPVILGPDGPSLGGFVCPVTVINADLWKLGQLKAGSKIRFKAISIQQAVSLEKSQQQAILAGQSIHSLADFVKPIEVANLGNPILASLDFQGEPLKLRPAGDHYLLIELGPMELSIERRFKVHALMQWLEINMLTGIREITPGIRSLQLHYDSQVISVDELTEHITRACNELAGDLPTKVPSRIVKIPLSWDDPACQEAIDKYTQSVRPNAPWCPSNLEFIQRINGLTGIQAVKDTVLNASYLVMGLGDVYLGAPVATPVDPRHRLVTTKYNPARTWTAENSVGIGGAYMCVYGMEGPGGYQFVGRTLQMWNRYRQTKEFSQPWLLRFFDQIQFYEVSAEELAQIRKEFPQGKHPIEIIDTEFDLDAYQTFLEEHDTEITAFQNKRHSAYEAELNHWRESGLLTYEAPEDDAEQAGPEEMPERCEVLESPATGNLWKLSVQQGGTVTAGQTLAILESMKMEIEIISQCDGAVHTILKNEGQALAAGQALFWIESH